MLTPQGENHFAGSDTKRFVWGQLSRDLRECIAEVADFPVLRSDEAAVKIQAVRRRGQLTCTIREPGRVS